MPPIGQSFTNQNFTNFVKLYPLPPPYGTPVPWLNYYGFKTNYAAVGLLTTNGLPVWQDYIAGPQPNEPGLAIRGEDGLCDEPAAAGSSAPCRRGLLGGDGHQVRDHLQHQSGRLDAAAGQPARHRRQHPLHRQPRPQRRQHGFN